MKQIKIRIWLVLISAGLIIKLMVSLFFFPSTNPALLSEFKSFQEVNEVSAEQSASTANKDAGSEKSSEDRISMWSSLKKRSEDLQHKEEKLREEEKRLAVYKKEIEDKITELKQIQDKIEQLLVKQKGVDEERMNRLVKFYESMEPEEAAPLVNKLEEGVATELFSRMNEKKAGKLLSQMEAERAIKISERLAERYRKGTTN